MTVIQKIYENLIITFRNVYYVNMVYIQYR